MTAENTKRKTGSFKNALRVPESLWVGLILVALGGLGGLLAVWRANDHAILQGRERDKAFISTLERIEKDIRQVEKAQAAHSGELGHPQAVMDRVLAVEKRMDRQRTEELANRKEFRADMRSGFAEVKKEIQALREAIQKK